MPLLPLLFFLGLALPYPVEEMEPIRVHLAEEAPNDWILGLACREDFKEVPGNVQSWCPESAGSAPTAVLYLDNIGDDLRLVKNILAHEIRHLVFGADGPEHDPFNEAASYRAGCKASWHPHCRGWLR